MPADAVADRVRADAASVPLATLTALQWVAWLALGNNVARALHLVPWAVAVNWWWSRWRSSCSSRRWAGWASRCCAPGCCCRRSRPGTYRRGGSVHLRVWLAERLAEASGADNLAGAPWLVYYARALGAKVGKGVDLHSLPPVTGLLTLGHRCAVEPEVDLSRSLDRRRRVPRRRDHRSATTRRSAPGPRCCPAPSSARTPTSRPARAWSARSRTASTGRARRR